jgi:hypothetical protein
LTVIAVVEFTRDGLIVYVADPPSLICVGETAMLRDGAGIVRPSEMKGIGVGAVLFRASLRPKALPASQ